LKKVTRTNKIKSIKVPITLSILIFARGLAGWLAGWLLAWLGLARLG
jgi:hypothetical protein